MYFSSDFIHLHFFISCSSLGFLNSAFFLIVYHRSWLLWGWLLKKCLCSLGGVVLLKGLYSCLHIWRRSHLPQSLLTVLVKYFLSVLQRFLKLSQTFNMDTLALQFLFTVWGQLSTMNAFSQYRKSRPSEDSLAFTFSMAVISAYICVPSPGHTDFGLFLAYAY